MRPMRPALVLRSLVSGLCVYVVAAACAATEHHLSTADGGVVDLGDAIAELPDVVADALSNPVGEAEAAPSLSVDVATEPCSTVLRYGSGEAYFAVHAYPGRSRVELSAVRAIVRSELVPDYPDSVGAAVFVRDGSVAAFCGLTGSGAPQYSVTFVLPR